MAKNKVPILLRIIQWAFPHLERWFPGLARRLFVTIFFTPLNYSVPPKEKVVEKQAEKFSIRAAGKRIQCYAWGAGPVVLLVHGWAGRATQFRKIIPAFVDAGFRVVGFDGPAHGRSQGGSTNIMEFEETMKVICDHVGSPQGIIAHSFGGPAALSAIANGLPVKKLVNIASPSIGDEIIATYLSRINGSAAIGEYLKSYVRKTTGKSFDEFTALHFVKKLHQPLDLLLIHDEDDKEVTVDHALELIKVYPTAALMRTSGLGHTRILRDEKVIEKCLSFIKN